jgi:hypothetical protein
MPRHPKIPDPDPFAPGFIGNHTLDHRPEVAKALGELCSEWALMELRMFAVFATLTDAPPRISRAIFYELNAIRTRMEMLKAVAISVIGPGKEFDDLDALLGKINKTARRRNAYVHDPWSLPITDPTSAAQIRLSGDDPSGELEEIDWKDLRQIAKQTREWADQLVRWINRVESKLPALHKKLREQPSLALALKRKG